MTVSIFSVIMSIVCSSVILVAAGFLVSHAKRVRWRLVLLVFLLGFLRLALPIDIINAKVIRSWYLYPFLRRLVNKKVLWQLSLAKLLGILWVVGSVIMFVKFFRRLRDLKDVENRAVPVIPGDYLYDIFLKAADDLNYKKGIWIAVTKEFSTAVSIGIFSPKVLIPKEMLSYPSDELEGVIKHELTHYLRRDVGKQWAFYVLQCVFWWNPAVHYLKRCVVQMLELECDEHACHGMSEEERLAYLEAMKKTLQYGCKRDLELGMGYGKNHSLKFFERRFREVLNPVDKYSIKKTWLLVLVSILLFMASYSFVVQSAGMPKDAKQLDEQMLIGPLGESTFLLRISDDTYYYVSGLIGKAYLTKEEIQKTPYVGLPIYDFTKGE